MVLVDTSVWIDYFKSNNESSLDKLIQENMVLTNDIILTELIPFAKHKSESGIVEGLKSLSTIPMDIDWIGLQMLQTLNLNQGVNKVGIPDLIICQQVLQHKVQLWSLDKHFDLIAKYTNLDLFHGYI